MELIPRLDVHLHAVIISYRRLPLLQACVESFLSTVRVPYSLCIVDNGSPREVHEYIRSIEAPLCFIRLPENRYPGYAANQGWGQAPDTSTLLMRSDNDSIWLPGWDSELAEAFADPSVGQYGFTAEGDDPWTAIDHWPCGGNTVIRRNLFEEGLRYDETPWPLARIQEDEQLYLDIRDRGYTRTWSRRASLIYNGMRDPEYDREVAEARGREYP
jgi:glycosyltransferase involved in cell wall biosynthesis